MKQGGAFAWSAACALLCVCLAPACAAAQAQGGPGDFGGPLTENPQVRSQSSRNTPDNHAPPRSDGSEPGESKPAPNESSSEQTRTDLSPPKSDEAVHPYGGQAAEAAREWNPLRAMKDVEVGTFYYKAGNYKAAIGRFREALLFKPRDAMATFKLAQALEKSGQGVEARTQYEAYLAILSDGPSAGEARKALQRLEKR
jgi:tetratricopeptide (TPR) repeat protein